MAKTWFIAKPGFSIDGTLGGARNLKNLVSRVVERFPSDLNMAKPGFSGSFKTVLCVVRCVCDAMPTLSGRRLVTGWSEAHSLHVGR